MVQGDAVVEVPKIPLGKFSDLRPSVVQPRGDLSLLSAVSLSETKLAGNNPRRLQTDLDYTQPRVVFRQTSDDFLDDVMRRGLAVISAEYTQYKSDIVIGALRRYSFESVLQNEAENAETPRLATGHL